MEALKLKLLLRVIFLTIILSAASLVFAAELIVTMLILTTIALTMVGLILGPNEAENSGSKLGVPASRGNSVTVEQG